MKTILLIALPLLLIIGCEDKDNESQSKKDMEENVYDKILYLTKAISPILLPLISGLGELQEEDVSTDYEDD